MKYCFLLGAAFLCAWALASGAAQSRSVLIIYSAMSRYSKAPAWDANGPAHRPGWGREASEARHAFPRDGTTKKSDLNRFAVPKPGRNPVENGTTAKANSNTSHNPGLPERHHLLPIPVPEPSGLLAVLGGGLALVGAITRSIRRHRP